MPVSDAFKKWYGTGSTFRFNNHAIFYQDEGAGDVLLCLHGFPTASWDWYRVWPQLTKRFRVIAPDMLGFGYSDKPQQDYSMLEQADLHEHLLAELGINKVHILAHDIGDTVTQEILARHLEKPKFEIESVCLLNGGLFPETHHPRTIQTLLLQPLIGAIITQFYSRSAFQRTFNGIFGANTQPTDDEIDEFWALLTKNGGKGLFHKLIRYIPERVKYRERWVNALQNAPMPLKLIDGLDDPVSGAHMVERYRELIPNPNVSELSGIGHYPQVEAPEAVIKAYFEFLDAV
jgi:pimeloyl-ACP methyl ester carboxylesterase